MNVVQRERASIAQLNKEREREKMKNEEDRVEGDNRESKQWRKLKVGKKNNVKKQKQNYEISVEKEV